MIRPTEDATVAAFRSSMGRLSLQASVTVSNLVNVETPGYRARDVRFVDVFGLTPASETGNAGSGRAAAPARQSRPIVVDAPSDGLKPDGNNVDVDREMARLGTFEGRYSATAQLVRKRFALLRYAVSDGRS